MAMLETGILSPRLPASRATRRLQVSFEFSPPKTAEAEETLWRAVTRLAPLKPRFMSVTYGAGGSTREFTHNTVRRIRSETDIPPAAHLTCVGAECREVDDVARAYWSAGIRHIVALRGDPPAGTAKFEPHPQGYDCGASLVAGLRKVADFEISVAAYPEIHPDSKSSLADLDNLKRKIDAGATRAISQFFFDTDAFLRFLDRAAMHGITVPIVPGILPVSNFATAVRFAKMCGAAIPSWLAHLFEGLDGDPDTRRLVAATVAAEQCRRLQAAGIDEFHFYTLNRADLSYAICHILGLRPAGASA
jgi:methylenetetrahydrofolate reductase (NADPH)